MPAKAYLNRDALIRLVFWGSVLLAAFLYYLQQDPIRLDSEEALASGYALVLEAKSDVALVIDYSSYPEEATRFDEIDFSLAWLNTLQQEIGPVALFDAQELQEVDLGGFRMVFLTRSAASNEALLPKLQSYVDRGGLLILELPSGSIREAFSADGLGGDRDPQKITNALGLENELMAALGELPLSTRLIGSSGPLDGAETLLTIDGVPVIYCKTVGAGHALTFDFDYGMLLTAIQQGQPSDELRVRNRRGSEAVETADLPAEDRLIDLDIAAADLLERFVIYGAVGRYYPVVGFWPYFDSMDGAFLVSHDEHGMGDAAAWMAEYEAEFSGSSSYFIRAPGEMTQVGLETLHGLGVDVAVEWNRHFDEGGLYRPVGVLGVEPFERALSLDEQIESLLGIYDNLPALVTVRSFNNLWGRDWAKPFQTMHAAELRADASYAPPRGEIGYLFGTGMPFMPIDDTGLGFDLLEFPTLLVAEGTTEERERLVELLDRSQAGDHQTLSVSFDPDTFLYEPSTHFYKNWRDAYRLAAERNHWITSVRNLYRFSRARHN